MAKSKKIAYGGLFKKPGPATTTVVTKKLDYGDGDPNLEQDAETELTELQKEFKESARKETELKEQNTSSEYYSVIVFKTQAQRDQFYEQLGITHDDNQYIDGQKLIKALQLKIDEINLKNPGRFKCNAEILNLAFEI